MLNLETTREPHVFGEKVEFYGTKSPEIYLENDIARDIVNKGWSVRTDFLPESTLSQLALETLQFKLNGSMTPIENPSLNELSKKRFIQCIRKSDLTKAQSEYFERLAVLQDAINESLDLGLKTFDCHLMFYPPGASYAKHLDCYGSEGRRSLTCILYLNDNWKRTDGGELRLYTDEDSYIDVMPQKGTLVVFLSAFFWHEVLPTSRERMCIPGWFGTLQASF